MPALRASRAILAAALLWQVPALAGPPASIDRTFTAMGDVTGDGHRDILTIHVTGASMKAPLRWTASITDPGDREIFRFLQSDASFDRFFHDPNFERHCSGYENCKARYYFHDAPAAFFAAIKPAAAAWRMDRYFAADLTATVTTELQRQNVPRQKVPDIIEEIKNILEKPGYHVLYLLTSPVEQTPPMIWVPSVQQFIPFYQE